MWIKRIVLKNFQSHSYSKMDLSPKINVFLGKGNRGKTAIIRALLWVFFNEPQGESIIRKGESIAKVSITLNDGKTVIRERGKGINRYILIEKDGETKEYSSFGRNVPEDIKRALKIKTLPIEHGRKLSPQIKEQMDSLYLLDETPSVIHTTLLTISGGHVIDEAIKSLATDIVKIQREKKEKLEEIEKLKSLLKNYEGIDEERDKLLKLKDILNDLKILINKKDRLSELRDELKRIDIKLGEFKKKFNILNRVEKVSLIMEEVEKIKVKLKELEEIKKRYRKNREETEKFEKVSKILDRDFLKEETIREIDNVKDRYTTLLNIRLKIKSVLEKEERLRERRDAIERNLNSLLERYVSVIGKEGICPVCLREMDEGLIEKVKENIKRMWR